MQTRKLIAPAAVLHIIVLSVCFLILMRIFEFPAILRMSSTDRLTLFVHSEWVIRLIYYLLTLTGFSQIAVSVLLYDAFDKHNTLLKLATVFGMLAGVFQAMGFVRWVVLIPFLGDALQSMESNVSPQNTVLLIEGTLNRYAGMAVGEHLGFMAQALWVVMLGGFLLHVKNNALLGWSGIAIGLLTIPVSIEALGDPFADLSILVSPVITAWSVWLVWLAVHLSRQPDAAVEMSPSA